MRSLSSNLFAIARPLFQALEPEAAHALALQSLKVSAALGITSGGHPTGLESRCMGLSFPTPLGLAAGCDKNGDYIDALAAVGFGFIEIGTVTPRPQAGRPRPRLFRLPEEVAIFNRMGFNNKGVQYAATRLRARKFTGVCGVNIGKNADTPNDKAAYDYLIGLRAVYAAADYVTVNLSSPNTPGLRDLQSEESLKPIVGALLLEREKLAEQFGRQVPILVKLSPDLADQSIDTIASVLRDIGADGVVATNTTTDLKVVQTPIPAGDGGGVSGKPLLERSVRVVEKLRSRMGEAAVIIGVGGITDGAAARSMLQAGANLLQIYSGFVYKGPALLQEIYDDIRSARVA